MRGRFVILLGLLQLCIILIASGSEVCIDKNPACFNLTRYECYDNEDICCFSCYKFITNLTSCKYGDRRNDCSNGLCSLIDFQSQCCWTCFLYNKTIASSTAITSTVQYTSSPSSVRITTSTSTSTKIASSSGVLPQTSAVIQRLTEILTTTTNTPLASRAFTSTVSTQLTQPVVTAVLSLSSSIVVPIPTTVVQNSKNDLTSERVTLSIPLPSSSQSQSSVIGIAVGVCVGGILLLTAVVIIVIYIKRKKVVKNTDGDEKKQFHENLKSISETLHASTMGKNNFSGTYKSSYQQSTIAPRKMVLSSSRPTSAYEYFQNSNVQQNETNDNIIDNADQVPSHFDHEHINK